MTRHDFSRWLGDVFRDDPLASHLRTIEERAGTEDTRDVAADVARAIRTRYETAADDGLDEKPEWAGARQEPPSLGPPT